MARSFVCAVLVSAFIVVTNAGCPNEGIGDPCTPEQEYNADFNGFDVKQVNTESKSFQCRTRLCLVNHFRGRVSCPYGQASDGSPTNGADNGCKLPGTDPATGTPVTGNPDDPHTLATVTPQCLDRTADKTVYCSCRCADINGNKPSGENFCDCPDGFACTQLVTSIGQGNEGLTGSYCIKSGTAYDPTTACNEGACDKSNPKTVCQ